MFHEKHAIFMHVMYVRLCVKMFWSCL